MITMHFAACDSFEMALHHFKTQLHIQHYTKVYTVHHVPVHHYMKSNFCVLPPAAPERQVYTQALCKRFLGYSGIPEQPKQSPFCIKDRNHLAHVEWGGKHKCALCGELVANPGIPLRDWMSVCKPCTFTPPIQYTHVCMYNLKTHCSRVGC